MLRILNKKISNGDLLKSIVLLPSVIISSYASNKKTKLEDIQKTEEVKIDSTSLDTSSLEILNNPLLQTSLTLMGIIGIGYLSYSYLPKITATAFLKAQEIDNGALVDVTVDLITCLILIGIWR